MAGVIIKIQFPLTAIIKGLSNFCFTNLLINFCLYCIFFSLPLRDRARSSVNYFLCYQLLSSLSLSKLMVLSAQPSVSILFFLGRQAIFTGMDYPPRQDSCRVS